MGVCPREECLFQPIVGQEHLCVFTPLGCYLSLYSEQLEDTERFFIRPGSQYRTAAQSFATNWRDCKTVF